MIGTYQSVSSSGFNKFLVEKFIEIVSRTLQITKNISIHPDKTVGILDETEQLNNRYLLEVSVRMVSMDF
jgi:hypothetical protein